MTVEWWYVKEGAKQGPVDESELRAMAQDGRLGREQLVWHAEMGDTWQKAGVVSGIFTAHPAAPSATLQSQPDPEPQPETQRSEGGRPRSVSGVSVIAPIGSAWSAMVAMLFKPFNFTKGVCIGFCVWLATLFDSGYEAMFGTFGDFAGKAFAETVGGNIEDFADGDLSALGQWGGVVLALSVIAAVVGAIVLVALLWLQSRGKFMLLDNALRNKGKIAEPWKTFGQHGMSLFKWTLCFQIVIWLVVALLVGGFFVAVGLPAIRTEEFVMSTLPAILILTFMGCFAALAVLYMMRFLDDFIVPLMYKHDMTALEAWAFFGKLYSANKGRLLLYGLFWSLLFSVAMIGIVIVVIVAVLATCCLLGIIANVPFVGQFTTAFVFAVLLLPFSMFFRYYSLYYFAQYGPGFDLVSGAECDEAEITTS